MPNFPVRIKTFRLDRILNRKVQVENFTFSYFTFNSYLQATKIIASTCVCLSHIHESTLKRYNNDEIIWTIFKIYGSKDVIWNFIKNLEIEGEKKN